MGSARSRLNCRFERDDTPERAEVASRTHPEFVPWLPRELIDDILSISARSSKEAAATLSLVSQSSCLIARPALFESLTLERRSTAFALADMLRVTPSIAALVKSLWMRECVPKDVELPILCARLERLAITPQAFSALCRFGNRVWREGDDDSARLIQPKQLLLFPGFVDWAVAYDCAGTRSPYSFTILTNLTHLYLSQASQFARLLAMPVTLSSLTHLATPLAGLPLSPLDVFRSAKFPKVQKLLVASRKTDPGLSPHCQFLAMEWDAEGLSEEAKKDSRVKFADSGTGCDANLLEAWKEDWECLWD